MHKIITALSLAGCLYAETLDHFIGRVIEHNPEIKAFESEVKAAEEDARIMAKLENPKMALQVTNIDFPDPANRSLEPMQQVMISLSQNIPLTSKLSAKEDAKKSVVESLKHKVSQKKLDLEFGLKQNGYALAKAKETKAVYDKYLHTLKFALELLRASNTSGGIPHNELIRGEMEIASFMRKIIDLESEQKIQIRKLQSFGVDVPETIECQFEMPEAKLRPLSIENSPEYAVINTVSLSLQKELYGEKLSLTPDLEVMLGYAGAASKFRDYWFFGLTIPLPVYGKEMAGIRKVEHELNANIEEAKNLRNSLSYELDDARIKFENAQKNYTLTHKILKTQLSHLLESALGTLKTSDASKPYVISAIKDALSLELDLIEYKYNGAVALAQIKKLTGEEI